MRPRDEHAERVEIEGLGQVVVRTLLHRLDRGFDAAESGHHQKDGPVGARPRLLQQPDPVEDRHLEIGDHDVGVEALDERERLLPVGSRTRLVSLVFEDLGQRLSCVGLVVDDEHSTVIRHPANST